MEIQRGIVRLGLEIEVAAWKPGESYRTVVADLLANDYMWDDGNQWQEWHQYHCNCEHAGCREVRSGNPIYPKPLVVATYDASLPDTGAEFVTSTIILTDDGMAMLKPVWDSVAGRAVWDNTIPSRAGGASSPSIHIHVSATSPNTDTQLRRAGSMANEDCLHALSLFAPELLAVASSAGIKRGLAFRQPLRYTIDTPHHGFIQVRNFVPNQVAYFEWRMFEAVYDDWEYVEACGFLAAGLTRGFLSQELFTRLMASGYTNPYDLDSIQSAVADDNLSEVLELVSRERLNILQDICLSELTDDAYGLHLLEQLFDKTYASIF